MMKKSFFLFFSTLFLLSLHSNAQFSRYIIKFRDKAGTPYTTGNPSQFLSQRAIDRRTRYNIPVDFTDLPVTPRYIDSIRLAGNVTILNVSKWLNQVCILTTDANALNKINNFPFVLAASPIAARIRNFVAHYDNDQNILTDDPQNNFLDGQRPFNTNDYYNYGVAYPQIHLHNAEFLHNHGFRGNGMQIAILDAGFYHYLTLPTFDSVRNNNQVLRTWDFVNREASVNEDHPHGMNCFSTIAANLPGSFIGTAPQSSFYLFRTEDANSEYPVEEQNWAAAAEMADSLGTDVITTSLGYNTFDNSIFDYTYADMNGKTSMIAKAATIAARKGLTILAAAGNEGNSSWHYICTPGDADSIITVGAVSPNGAVAGFSSYGPSADNRIKPDVAAVGAGAVVANQSDGQPSYNNGTSFSTPIMAGITTCLWQAFPEFNNISIIDALHRSANNLATPDSRTGYGIPDVKKAFVMLLKKLTTLQISATTDCSMNINWTTKCATDMNFSIERKTPADTGFIPFISKNTTNSWASTNFSVTNDVATIPAGTPLQYRIKMNIATDTSFYFDTLSVIKQACNSLHDTISITPNPFKDYIQLNIYRTNTTGISVKIHSSLGQLLLSREYPGIVGNNSFQISTREFAKDIYYITVYEGNRELITKKLLKN